MGHKLNLTPDEIKQAQGGPIPALPAATYAAKVYKSEFVEKAKNSGKPMYVLDFAITDGPVQTKRKVRAWFSIQPSALFKLVELHKAIGFAYPKTEEDAGEFEFPDENEYLNQEVNIKLTVTSRKGLDDEGNEIDIPGNNVARVLPFDPDKVDHDLEEEDAPVGGSFL